MTLHLTGWHKASYSGKNGGCIEVGTAPGIVGIRDTKNRNGGTLIVDSATFSTFLTQVKADQLR
ncbi:MULTISPECIES: DUF397 domain-containing protein [Actinoalloteichus]|uniref:DUF397 family protein n=1 Tax=Actinoalloteichus fjordicus TaxID=1612552 RepID=A0AAC9LFB3_9PSEU|nr:MULTISPECIES: DUF397 domain-containing protein [Actinoalloteichus]APU15722.1 putative DUF397 family protein [Actinoalloteichus fjordicus]APU21782.1 putative DUF397 family protein [Actinoalloteichus sp. GBA129-24]